MASTLKQQIAAVKAMTHNRNTMLKNFNKHEEQHSERQIKAGKQLSRLIDHLRDACTTLIAVQMLQGTGTMPQLPKSAGMSKTIAASSPEKVKTAFTPTQAERRIVPCVGQEVLIDSDLRIAGGQYTTVLKVEKKSNFSGGYATAHLLALTGSKAVRWGGTKWINAPKHKK